jgi:hypothetical protein
MTEQQASQSPEVQETVVDEKGVVLNDAFEAFGLTLPEQEETKPESENEQDPPATEEPEKKGITVKYNKEERFVDENEIPELVQKGLALEKERERKGELQQALDRAAKLAGFEDHEDYLANLDTLEQQRQRKQEDELTELRNNLLDDLEYNGVDRAKAEQFIDNHPLLKQAHETIEERQRETNLNQQETARRDWEAKWKDLYDSYPDITESAKVFSEGGLPDWYTPQMETLINRGYEPIHAYELTQRDKIQSQTKKQLEQKLIKEQRLGTRAQVETETQTELEPEVPQAVSSAFSLFGMNPKSANKYFK